MLVNELGNQLTRLAVQQMNVLVADAQLERLQQLIKFLPSVVLGGPPGTKIDSVVGDLNGDGVADSLDIDLLDAAIARGDPE